MNVVSSCHPPAGAVPARLIKLIPSAKLHSGPA
jgi:hypothetical protein